MLWVAPLLIAALAVVVVLLHARQDVARTFVVVELSLGRLLRFASVLFVGHTMLLSQREASDQITPMEGGRGRCGGLIDDEGWPLRFEADGKHCATQRPAYPLSMARYFFDLNECGRELSDPEGVELPDIAAARAEAIKVARAVMQEEVSEGRLCLGCAVLIRVGYAVVEHVPFRSAIQVTGLIGPV